MDQITSFHSKQVFKYKSLPLKHKVTCELSNVIYIINCNKCGLRYIGETKRPIRNRMYEHYNSVQKLQSEKSTPVSRHFTQNNHSVKNMEFSIFHWMGDPTSPNASTKCKSHSHTPPNRHQHVCIKNMPSHGTPYPSAPLPLLLRPRDMLFFYKRYLNYRG